MVDGAGRAGAQSYVRKHTMSMRCGMKKILKVSLIVVGCLIVVGLVAGYLLLYHAPIPKTATFTSIWRKYGTLPSRAVATSLLRSGHSSWPRGHSPGGWSSPVGGAERSR